MPDSKVLKIKDAISEYGEKWIEIVEKNAISPTMLPGWMLCVSGAFEQDFDVYIQHIDRNVVGIIPYYKEIKSFLGLNYSTVSTAGNLVSYHQEFVIVKGYEDIVISSFLDYMFQSGINVIMAGQFLKTSQSYLSLLSKVQRDNLNYEHCLGESSPYLDLNCSWDELLQTKARKFRYKVKSRQKELLSNTNLEIKWYSKPEDVEAVIQLIYKIEAASWKVDGKMDITSNDAEQNYYELLLPYMAAQNMLKTNVLFIGGEPASYNLYYVWCNKVGQIKTSFDEKFKEHSPGATLIEASLRECIEDNISEFDFLGGVMPHKTSWTKLTREHESLFIYNQSFKLNLIFFFKQLKKKLINKNSQ